MARTLRRINKLIEIAMLTYTIAFKILMIGGELVKSIIESGGEMGMKSKEEDTVEGILKGLANVVLYFNSYLFPVFIFLLPLKMKLPHSDPQGMKL